MTTCGSSTTTSGRAARRGTRRAPVRLALTILAGIAATIGPPAAPSLAQSPEPSMLLPGAGVRRAVSGLVTPIGLAVLNLNSMFVIEKNTGKVQYVVNGAVDHTALDLAVNNASERGLLGIALDRAFSFNGFVYLYWTNRTAGPQDPLSPLREAPDVPELGPDTDDILAVPLLGNRVDRFVWNGATLTFDRNLIKLRAFQADGVPTPPGQGDEAQEPAGNHNGGVIRIGPDGKLYIIIGDNGRRGALQNLPFGPKAVQAAPAVADDQFGGPEPDDAHFTGVIIRLNTDGTTPTDNPFYQAGAAMGGEAGANVQRTFAYGFRNSFGMAFDPLSRALWMSENGDDTFDELNRIDAGHNSGWIQMMGPSARVAEFKAIETSTEFFGLQQLRYPPTFVADAPADAMSRLFVLPGSHFSEPEFSWRYAVAPAAIGFIGSKAFGDRFVGDLVMGFSEAEPLGGPLLRFRLNAARDGILATTPGLADLVDDNAEKHELAESGGLVVGRDFGIVTDIQTARDGNLLVVSLDKGAVYEIFRQRPR
jgi:glucose/arabinose dehydrogenase